MVKGYEMFGTCFVEIFGQKLGFRGFNCDIHLLQVVDGRDSYIVVLKGGNQRFFLYSSNNIMEVL